MRFLAVCKAVSSYGILNAFTRSWDALQSDLSSRNGYIRSMTGTREFEWTTVERIMILGSRLIDSVGVPDIWSLLQRYVGDLQRYSIEVGSI